MKKVIIICSLMCSIFLISCSNGKQMEKSFEQIHTLETEMSSIQEKVYRLDEEEAMIYEEIIAMGTVDETKIEELANEAFLKLEKKLQYLKEEKEIYNDTKEELIKLGKLNEKETDEAVSEMYLLLQERYTYYEDMYDEQVRSIQLNEELYELLAQGANRKQVEETLHEINEHEVANRANHEQINILTERYNELILER